MQKEGSVFSLDRVKNGDFCHTVLLPQYVSSSSWLQYGLTGIGGVVTKYFENSSSPGWQSRQ